MEQLIIIEGRKWAQKISRNHGSWDNDENLVPAWNDENAFLPVEDYDSIPCYMHCIRFIKPRQKNVGTLRVAADHSLCP